MEDDEVISPLMCAWDFVLPGDNKKPKPGGNETALNLHVNLDNIYLVILINLNL